MSEKKLENVGDLELYNVRSAHCKFLGRACLAEITVGWSRSIWNSSGRRLASCLFQPIGALSPTSCLQFQKFFPCSLLYILAAHLLSRPALIFSLIHSPRENRTQIRLPESINTLQPEQLFTLYYTSVHCLRRNSDLKVGFPESINSSLLPRLCLT